MESLYNSNGEFELKGLVGRDRKGASVKCRAAVAGNRAQPWKGADARIGNIDSVTDECLCPCSTFPKYKSDV
jgi:hypothetical protein